VFLILRAGVRQMWPAHPLGFWEDGRQSLGGAVFAAALIGCAGLLVHSLVDFNLQIPANAALFYVLAAVASVNPPSGELDE